MLMSVTIETNSARSFDVGTRLIRAEAAYGAIVDGTGCQFTYPYNDRDRREKNSTIKISETQANLVTAMDLAYNAVSIALLVHPGNVATASTVSTVFSVTDIIWGAPYTPDSSNKSYVWIQEGAFKVNMLLIDYTLTEIINLAGTGSII
jgi:hypothetical protein